MSDLLPPPQVHPCTWWVGPVNDGVQCGYPTDTVQMDPPHGAVWLCPHHLDCQARGAFHDVYIPPPPPPPVDPIAETMQVHRVTEFDTLPRFVMVDVSRNRAVLLDRLLGAPVHDVRTIDGAPTLQMWDFLASLCADLNASHGQYHPGMENGHQVVLQGTQVVASFHMPDTRINAKLQQLVANYLEAHRRASPDEEPF